MQTDWSNDLTMTFLEHYASERLLWDSTDKNHKFKHKVRDAWKRISLKMDSVSIDELKMKKKSLMATFRPLLKKKKVSISSGAGPDDVFQPIWFAYDLMESFLGTIYGVEETINTEDTVQQSETMMPSPSTSHSNQPPRSDEISLPTATEKNTKNTNATKINACRKRPNKNMELSLETAQKKITESFDTLNDVLKRKRVEEDDCDMYGKLIATRLRKYPQRMRDKIMYKIDGLLLDNPYPDNCLECKQEFPNASIEY